MTTATEAVAELEDIVAANVSALERVVSVVTGAALLYLAARERRLRPAATLAGAGFLGRGVTGFCPINAATGRDAGLSDPRRALAGPRGIHVYETMVIDRSPDELFRFWRDFTNLPRFMEHLEQVKILSPTRSRWTAKAPLGRRVRWEAEVINEIQGELIGWQSTEHADVASAGSVRFRPVAGGGTEVIVHLQYEPPAGRLGGWVAWMFGEEPALQIRDDLRRLKDILEVEPAVAAHSLLLSQP